MLQVRVYVEGEEQFRLFQGGIVMKGKEISLLMELRKNSRQSLTAMSINSDVPLATVFKHVNKLHRKSVIVKDTCLVDFSQLGFPIKIGVFIRSGDKCEARRFLEEHPSINTLLRLSGDYDFYAELFFENMLRYQDFVEELGRFGAKTTSVHFVEDIKQEEFEIREQE